MQGAGDEAGANACPPLQKAKACPLGDVPEFVEREQLRACGQRLRGDQAVARTSTTFSGDHQPRGYFGGTSFDACTTATGRSEST